MMFVIKVCVIIIVYKQTSTIVFESDSHRHEVTKTASEVLLSKRSFSKKSAAKFFSKSTLFENQH